MESSKTSESDERYTYYRSCFHWQTAEVVNPDAKFLDTQKQENVDIFREQDEKKTKTKDEMKSIRLTNLRDTNCQFLHSNSFILNSPFKKLPYTTLIKMLTTTIILLATIATCYAFSMSLIETTNRTDHLTHESEDRSSISSSRSSVAQFDVGQGK